MKHPFLIGKQIYLRGLEKEDLAGDYFQWLNDFEVTRFLDSGRTPNTTDAMDRYYSRTVASQNDVLFAIVEKQSDRHIGNVKLGSIDWVHRSADLGIMIGASDCWDKGHGTEAIRLTLSYGFRRLNLHKIILGVAVDQARAIRAYEKAGFTRQGVVTDFLFIDGRYTDKLIMGISEGEFRDTDA